MRNLILHHLEAIIESGSVIGACRRLFLSQPALSQYIKRLEAEYGIVIFDRSVSPWKLTEEGEHLLETQRKIQQLDEECRQFFRDRKGLKSGTVRIGSTAYRTATILNPILSVYKKQYPNVIVRIEEGTTQEVAEFADNGEGGLLICYFFDGSVFSRVCRDLQRKGISGPTAESSLYETSLRRSLS